jgi:hypothetical protein
MIFKKDAMKDEAFKAEYELLGPEFEIITKCIKSKKKINLFVN